MRIPGRGAVAWVVVMLPATGWSAGPPDAEFECLLEPHVEVKLSAPVPGVLESVEVDRGDRVKRGQVLARLKSEVENAAVELATAKVEFGQRKVARSQQLFQENFLSEYNVDEAVTETRLAEMELRQAEAMLAQRTITSPINGLVVERLRSPGEYVADDEFLRLAQIDPLDVDVVVPVTHFGAVQIDMPAEVTAEQPVGGTYRAKVVNVDRVIDAASGTFGVRLEMPNKGNQIPAGLKCRVRFLAAG